MRPHHLILPILGAGLLFLGVPESGAVQASLDLRTNHDDHAASRNSADDTEARANRSSSMGSLRSATDDGTDYYAYCMNTSVSEESGEQGAGNTRELRTSGESKGVRAHGHGDETLSDNDHGSNGSSHNGSCPRGEHQGGGSSGGGTGGGSIGGDITGCGTGGGGEDNDCDTGGGSPPSSSHDVPEPASAVLLAAGIFASLGFKRRSS